MVPDIITGNAGADWLLQQGSHSAAAWADVAVINPWTMYLMYGDKDILKKQYGLRHVVSDGGAMGLVVNLHHYFGQLRRRSQRR